MITLLEPDRDQIEIFVNANFRYAKNGFVSLRAFHEGEDTVFRISSVRLLDGNLKFLIDVAEDDARRAAQSPKPVVFCPPIAVFAIKEHAREQDLLRGLALSVECDQGPQAAREKLEQLLGAATVVVASGGEWVDPATGEVQPKLHLHWRLSHPVEDKAALADLKAARDIAARLVGADPSNKPIVHPIRWPGSWHRKGEPKLCTIVSVNGEREIDLARALAALQQAAPKTNGKSNGKDRFETYDEQTQGATWAELIAEVLSSESYHEPLVRLAAKLITAGTRPAPAIGLLRGWMEAAAGPRDQRWQARYADIPRAVSTAEAKYGSQQQQPPSGIRPVDLWGYFQPPELPRGVLPSVIETFAFVTGEMMGADPAGLAISALVVAGAAIPDGIRLQVKRHSRGWTEEARLWAFLVGLPSVKKSPILRAAATPLIRIDHRLYRVYLKAQAEFDKLDPKERKGKEPPRKHRLRIEDTTIEAAAEVLKDSPDGVLCLQDELSGWFGGMDKYAGPRGASKDRGFWLQSWNGGEYAVDRISRGSFLIPNLSISVLGGIQPDAIRRIAGDTVDDGLIQRPLPVILRSGRVGHDQPTPPVVEQYDQLIERLHKLRAPSLEFDPGAQDVRTRLERKHNELLALETVHRKLAAHIGKYDGYFARLCIVWHCIEHAQSKELPVYISADTAERVARFMHEFLLPHALAFYSGVLALADDHDRLNAVAGYILARGLECITTRDVARGDRTMRRLSRQDTNAVFEQLEALGWVARKSAPRPSDPPHWVVNPQCHQLFENRAREEAERRTRVHQLIKQFVRAV